MNFDHDTESQAGLFSDLVNIPEPPKYRAWKAEEVPVGAVVRDKGSSNYNCILITGVAAEFEKVAVGQRGEYTLEQLFREFEHSTDNGKTWHPCGVLEVP